MADVLTASDLSTLNDRIGQLQKSARRTLPMFVIGILATLCAAAIALYYIFTLSGDLKAARAALHQSETRLAAALDSLEVANAALHQAKAASTSPANAVRITAAISDLSRSQQDLVTASDSIRTAAAKLPASSSTTVAQAPAPVSTAGWFAVVGSYPIDAPGLAGAMEQQQRAQKAGLCVELWQTKISHNYAVVIGSRTDRATAVASAGAARKGGVATDAFAQPDREWTKLPQSPDC